MSGPSKVIVLDPDPRAGRQVQLGFEREGIAAAAPALPADLAQLEIREPPGLVVVGGTNAAALDTLRRARELLTAAGADVPILFTGRGIARSELEAAGADEIIARPVYLRDLVTIGRVLLGLPADKRDHLVGSLAETTGVYTLVRALSALGRSAVLTLIRGLRRGEVRFFRGEVTSAQVGLIHGQAALHQLLLWTDARFDFAHQDVVRRQQIPLAPDELLADAERFLEGVREAAGSLSPATVLEPDVQRVQDLGKLIPTEVHGVLRMFDGHRVLADILEDSPYRVFETLRVAQKAVEAGLLRRVDSQRPKATWKAVLAIDEWLVGSDTRDAVVERTSTIETGPVTAKKPKGKRRKKVVDPAIEPGSKAGIDWGALVPRIIGGEVGPLSPVVPALAAAGEVEISPATRDSKREGLEALMDTDKRDRIFPTDIGLEPSVVIAAEPETTDEWERVAAEAKARASKEVTAPVPIVDDVDTKSGATRRRKKKESDGTATTSADSGATKKPRGRRESKPKIESAAVAAQLEADKARVDAQRAQAKADEEARAAEVARAEEQRVAAEIARAEESRIAAEKAKADEDARLAAEEAKADEEARLAAEEAKVDEEARRAAAAAEAEARERAEAAAWIKAAEEAKAKADAEEKARADEDARIAAEKARADEDARIAAEKAKAAEDARIADEEARERAEAAAWIKAAEDAKAKADEDERARTAAREAEREAADAKASEAASRAGAADEARAYAARVKAAAEAKRLEAERNAMAGTIDAAATSATDASSEPAEHRSLPASELVRALVAEAIPVSTSESPSAAVTAPVRTDEGDAVTTPFMRADADSIRAYIAEPVTVAENASTTVAVADVLTVKGAADTAHLTATPIVTISERRLDDTSATPIETEDEPSDGIIRSTITSTSDSARLARLRQQRPPGPEHDGPAVKETTGEIRERPKRTTLEPRISEPSILVADLAAVHAAASAIASQPVVAVPPPAAAPASEAAPAWVAAPTAAPAAAPTPAPAEAVAPKPLVDAASSSRELEVSDVRRDAVAFTDDEEAFFNRAESHTNATPKLESFDDLDDGYEPQPGFWDRVFGRKKK